MTDIAVVESEKKGDEVVVKLLSPADLQQFLQRRGAVETARLSFQMIAQGYEAWAAGLRVRYGIIGKFEVDPRTGQVHMIKEPDGGSDAG